MRALEAHTPLSGGGIDSSACFISTRTKKHNTHYIKSTSNGLREYFRRDANYCDNCVLQMIRSRGVDKSSLEADSLEDLRLKMRFYASALEGN